MSLDDPRLEWMRDKVCLGLNVDEEVSIFNNLNAEDYFRSDFMKIY